MIGPKQIVPFYVLFYPVGFLVDDWLVLLNFTGGSLDDQITLSIYSQFLRAFEGQLNHVRIGSRGDYIVKLKLAMIAVVDDIYPRIYSVVRYPCVVRNISAPLFRIITNEVVALARSFITAFRLRRRIGAQ